MRVHPDVSVGAEDRSHRNRGAKVGKGVDRLAVPRARDAHGPDEVRDVEHDHGLVEAVEHVHPELEPGVLQSSDTTNVELWECKCGLGVDILVKGWKGMSALSSTISTAKHRYLQGR